MGDAGGDGTSGSRISLELPAGGQMSHVAIGPDGTWYAASDTSGVFRSDDHMTWIRCGARAGLGLTVSSDNAVWLAGPDIGRSTDRCATWQATGSPRFSQNVVAVTAPNAAVYGLTDIGLEVWSGTSWTPVPTTLDNNRFLSLAGNNSGLIAGTSAGITHSTNGVTWTTITTGVPPGDVRDLVAGPTHAYLITGFPGAIGCGSGDGNTWTTCFNKGGFSLAVDPVNDQRVASGVYDDLVVTGDIFNTVTGNARPNAGLDSALVLDMAAAADGTNLAATDRGVFYSASFPLAFLPRLTGLDAWDIDRIVRDGDHTYVATRGGVLHALGGAPFTISTTGITGNTNIRSVAVDSAGRVFAVGRNIFRSDDHGASWQSIHDLDVTDAYVATSILIGDGGRLYVGSGTRLLIADPPYTTWTPHQVTATDQYVNALVRAGSELWAGTAVGVYRSLDDGTTFTQIGPTQAVRTITLLADGGLAVGTISNLYLSDPGRTTFQISLPQRNITSLREVGTTLVVTTETGVAYSTDRGCSWMPLPGAETMSASDVLADGDLVIGSNSGLVRLPLP